MCLYLLGSQRLLHEKMELFDQHILYQLFIRAMLLSKNSESHCESGNYENTCASDGVRILVKLYLGIHTVAQTKSCPSSPCLGGSWVRSPYFHGCGLVSSCVRMLEPA